MAKLKDKSGKQLSVLAGRTSLNLFALTPVISSLATVSRRLGSTGLYADFTYPALFLLSVLSVAKDGNVYFIPLCNYCQAAGRNRAELYLLLPFTMM